MEQKPSATARQNHGDHDGDRQRSRTADPLKPEQYGRSIRLLTRHTFYSPNRLLIRSVVPAPGFRCTGPERHLQFVGEAALSFRSGRLAQLVRAPLSHSGGHWFESSIAHLRTAPRAEVAEWQTRYIQGVVSFTGVGVQISPSASQS